MRNLIIAILIITFIALILVSTAIGLYYHKGNNEFIGFLIGSILCYLFSVSWILSAKKGILARAKTFIYYIIGGIIIRLAIFIAALIIIWYILPLSMKYFILSFLTGTTINLAIEVWYCNFRLLHDIS